MASKAAQAVSAHLLQFDIQWSSLALVYYDYALTLPMEIKYMWCSKFRLSTVLYILCRYALVANVLYLLAIAKQLGESCDTWYKIIGALSVLGRAAVIVTFSARTYAIFNCDRWVLTYFSIVGLTCVVLDIMDVPGLKCTGGSSIQIVNTLLSILMVVFEYSSAILTIIRCIQAFRTGGPWRNQKSGFLYLIFEQGVLYFSVVSLFTTGAVVLNFRAQSGSFFQRLLNALTLPLSGILTARFLLHLRKWESNLSRSERSFDRWTLGEFRVASAVLSSLIEDFGEDPVALAKSRSRIAEEPTSSIMEAGT